MKVTFKFDEEVLKKSNINDGINDSINDGINDSINDSIKLSKNEETILKIIKNKENITREELINMTNLSQATVDRSIKSLKDKKILKKI